MSGLRLYHGFQCNGATLTQLEEEGSCAAAHPGWQAAGTRGSVPQNRRVEFTQEDVDHGGACCDHTFASHCQSHGEVWKPCEASRLLFSLAQRFLRKLIFLFLEPHYKLVAVRQSVAFQLSSVP